MRGRHPSNTVHEATDYLDAMTPEDRMDALVESPLLGITDTNPGDYVWSALRIECGEDHTNRS